MDEICRRAGENQMYECCKDCILGALRMITSGRKTFSFYPVN